MVQTRDIIFDLRSLTIHQPGGQGGAIVKNAKLTIREGEIIGLFGDSGSGKTLSMLSIIGLVPNSLETEMDIDYFPSDPDFNSTKRFSPPFFQALRRDKIAFIFQQAASCLNPLIRVRKQISECLPHSLSRKEKNEKVREVLATLGFNEPDHIAHAYPHELSVGQQQRVMFAQAIVRDPALIIADEPFAGLDRVTAAKVVDLIRKIHIEMNFSFIIISHDVSMLSGLAGGFVRMKDGQLERVEEKDLTSYIPVYPRAQMISKDVLPEETVLTVEQVSKSYRRRKGLFAASEAVNVLENASFEICKGEIVGLMGESGSGKSTLGRLIAGLEALDSGKILLGGSKIKIHRMNGWKTVLPQKVQMVFQDPYTSFEPSKPMIHYVHGKQYAGLMTRLGLNENLLNRRPFELSGGQLQRFSLLRALLLEPKVLILDESLSAIDSASRIKILDLLKDHKDRMAILLISHVPEIVLSVSDRLIMLKSGMLKDLGPLSSLSYQKLDKWSRDLLGVWNEVT